MSRLDEEGMSLTEHLGELRRRIIWVLSVFTVCLIAGMYFAGPAIEWMKHTGPAEGIEWNVFSPWDPLRVYMQFSFAIAAFVTLPVMLYHLWAFVKPGLRPIEQRATLKFIPFSVLLFALGAAFGYYVVFPMAFYFTTVLTDSMGLTQTYGVTQYFTFMFNILIPLAMFFELPLVIMFLTAIRLLNPSRLHKIRKYAYFVLLIVSAVITPPDMVSAIIVCIPMIILYEISIVVSKIVFRKQQEQDRAWEAEFGPK
jgi:sec-independent protein translocase protein TatC